MVSLAEQNSPGSRVSQIVNNWFDFHKKMASQLIKVNNTSYVDLIDENGNIFIQVQMFELWIRSETDSKSIQGFGLEFENETR